MQKYISLSIELHLFFARIMKEHALFLKSAFPAKDASFIEEAEWYKNQFERLLLDVVSVSNGVVSSNVLDAQEIVTEYTKTAEEMTERLLGIAINSTITDMENNLQPRINYAYQAITPQQVQMFNNRALELVNGLINFKERIINQVLTCNLFTTNYLLLIEHILREAKLYRSYIIELETHHDIISDDLRNIELFWNQIMMEHALFIRGLLDPTESDLINTANNFANEYRQLLMEATNMTDAMVANVTNKTIQETLKYRDFKTAANQGLIACKIKAIALPLLADHVLREANHYLRILGGKTANRS